MEKFNCSSMVAFQMLLKGGEESNEQFKSNYVSKPIFSSEKQRNSMGSGYRRGKSMATYLHEMVVDKINKLKEVYTPPVEMMDKWEHDHKEYVEKAAWIKTMLGM